MYTYGTITLNSTTATSNGNSGFPGDGAYLDNCLYNNTTNLCTTVTPTAVNITGTNIFNSNYGDGLVVFSKGTITVNSITADYNGQADDNFNGEYGSYRK